MKAVPEFPVDELEKLSFLDDLIADALMTRLSSEEPSLADIDAARKYLAHKDFRGTSLSGAVKVGRPILNLADIPASTLAEGAQALKAL